MTVSPFPRVRVACSVAAAVTLLFLAADARALFQTGAATQTKAQDKSADVPKSFDIGSYGAALRKRAPRGLAEGVAKLAEKYKEAKFDSSGFSRRMFLKGLERKNAANGPLPFGATAEAALDSVKSDEALRIVREGAKGLSGLVFPTNLRERKTVQALRFGATNVAQKRAAPAGTENGRAFDFRSLQVVSPVSDQSPCGACWAFSTIGGFEAVTAIFATGGRRIKFSEQYLLNCTPPNTSNPSLIPNNCAGGFWGDALDLMKRGVPWVNLANPQDPWAFKGQKGACRPIGDDRFKVLEWGFVDENRDVPDPVSIKAALCRYGPIIAGVGAETDAFLSYSGGILKNDPAPPDHAILIIGWKDYGQDPRDGAWLIKNSWGPDWGVNGFGYIDYNSNTIGIQATYLAPAPLR